MRDNCYRWFLLGARHVGDKLTEKLAASTWGPNGGFHRVEGFGVGRFEFAATHGVRIQQLIEGDVHTVVVPAVSSLEFCLFSVGELSFMRVDGDCDSLSVLIAGLETTYQDHLMCEPVRFGLNIPRSVAAGLDSFELTGLTVTDAAIAPGVVGTIHLRSSSAILERTIGTTGALSGRPILSTYHVLYRGVRGEASFSASGVARISETLAPRIAHLIENELPALAA